MLSSLRSFSNNEVARKRMDMIAFYDQFGEKAVKQAFGADRKLISRWKKRLASSGGKLSSLIPTSTRPHQCRTPKTDPRILAFIKKEREDHPRIGKEKLKPDVDAHCVFMGIATVSASTIGNNMKDFYRRFTSVYPATVRVWQSDNGSENLGVFDRQLEEDKIPHLFIYPPQLPALCPKTCRLERLLQYQKTSPFSWP